jgi:DNA ligase-1
MQNIVFTDTLYGVTKTDKCYEWTVTVEQSTETNRKGQPMGLIHLTRGLVDGKKATTTTTIKNGKNIGKVNETTPVEQAISQAESKRNKKLDDGYDYTIEASRAKYEDQLKPMLAQSYDKHFKKIQYPCFVQPKLDGIRCLGRKRNGVVSLFSRQGKPLDLIPHVAEALDAILEEGQCTDGEIYVHGWEFQRIVSAVKKTSEDTPLLEYHIYDLPDQLNKDTPFTHRFSEEQRSVIEWAQRCLVPVETVYVSSTEELMEYEEKAVSENYEGVMARNADSLYLFGHRSYDLQKVKRFEDAEYKIVGVTDGISIEEGCAIFTCVTEDGLEFSVRPTGTHEERKEMFNRKEEFLGKLLTVKFQGKSTDNVPRFPVGLHVREEWDLGGAL